ncbi:DUF317 domain-containing protein [Streptomyces sp. ISL-12]|uniref:DUF317 domain-containing protein n=1 Tax=Streptomyces sp. ISL-12 TaxID=2819177 RepID=UPI001BE97293|nr:DUF317 domain-containing protein [Streptomyces sp. ISL-12]MBT2409342.1 DUF317 domain-containing protein [Streptomyces sp. ISL-12]
MPVSNRQLAEFADKHAGQVLFDTSPRHLAGPGDARHVTHGLAAAGWTRINEPLSTHLVLASPDHRHRLQFTPETGYLASWWQLSTAGFGNGYWRASFGAQVPAEVISSLTDALIDPPADAPPEPWQTVEAAGWVRAEDGTARSSDGMCVIQHRAPSEFRDAPEWSIDTYESGDAAYPGPLIWHARFHADTPVHLVNAFVAALTDTSPLQRGMLDRTGHYSAVQEPSRLSPEQVVAAHTKRVKAIKAQDRVARHRQRLTTAPAAAHRTGTAPPRR